MTFLFCYAPHLFYFQEGIHEKRMCTHTHTLSLSSGYSCTCQVYRIKISPLLCTYILFTHKSTYMKSVCVHTHSLSLAYAHAHTFCAGEETRGADMHAASVLCTHNKSTYMKSVCAHTHSLSLVYTHAHTFFYSQEHIHEKRMRTHTFSLSSVYSCTYILCR